MIWSSPTIIDSMPAASERRWRSASRPSSRKNPDLPCPARKSRSAPASPSTIISTRLQVWRRRTPRNLLPAASRNPGSSPNRKASSAITSAVWWRFEALQVVTALLRPASQAPGPLLLQTCNRVEIMVEGNGRGAAPVGPGRADGSCSKAGTRSASFSLAPRHRIDDCRRGPDHRAAGEKALACSFPHRSIYMDEAVAWASGIPARPIDRTVSSRGLRRSACRDNSGRSKADLARCPGARGKAAEPAESMSRTARSGMRIRARGEVRSTGSRLNELSRYITLSDVVRYCVHVGTPPRSFTGRSLRRRCGPGAGESKAAPGRWSSGTVRPSPRDVEEGSGTIDGVHFFTIDDLREVNEQTMSTRSAEAERAAAAC